MLDHKNQWKQKVKESFLDQIIKDGRAALSEFVADAECRIKRLQNLHFYLSDVPVYVYPGYYAKNSKK